MPKATPPLRIGFIGASFISQVVHLPCFSAVPDVQIAAIADPRQPLREAVAQQFGATPVNHHDDLLNDPTIDAVAICVFRRCQAPLAARALAAGKPVFSEKPLAYSYAEAIKNVALARAKNLPYAVGYMKRFDAGVRRFRTLLQDAQKSGEYGELLHVQARNFCPTNDIPPPPHIKPFFPSNYRYEVSPPGPESLPKEYAADYDYTLNVISHDINLLHYLFGTVFTAERFAVRSGRMQVAQLSTAGFDVSLAAGLSDRDAWDQEIEVFFRHGRLRLILPSPLDRTSVATIMISRPGMQERIPPEGSPMWAFAAQAANFIEACRGKKGLDSSAEDASFDLSLIEALWEKAVWHP